MASSGVEVVGTRSILLPEIEEGGRILQCETGLRLLTGSGLPRLIKNRVRDLVTVVAAECCIDPRSVSFVIGHPRGAAVLEAIAEGLAVDGGMLAASWSAWRKTANMVSASIYRGITELANGSRPSDGDLGILVAFGTGVTCEVALLRWHSTLRVMQS